MAVKTLFSLGAIYPSDFLKLGEQPRCAPFELKLVMDENGLVHLDRTAPKEVLWGERYWYRSSVTDSMRRQLRDIVDSILQVTEVKAKNNWVDLAGNDGYLLSQVPSMMTTVSIDPVGGEIYETAKGRCDVVIKNYFSKEVYREIMGVRNAKVISCISMLYDISDLDSFLKDVYDVLDDDGIFCVQVSYTPLMIQQLEIGNICHEHYYYFSFSNLKPILERNGFNVLDVSINNTNAGSMRLFIIKDKADITKFGSATHRNVCQFRIKSLLHYEEVIGINHLSTWIEFYAGIQLLKQQTVDFITEEKKKGKVIMGYGASTKFNTTLQVFGLTSEHIIAISERSPEKYGLHTIGSNIPIISEYEMRKQKPDYLLVGPTHFISEFKEREQVLLKTGTKFITIMPSFQIIGA